MPNLGKGTECVKILLSQVSKDTYEPLVPMFFLSLAHMYVALNFNIQTSFGRGFVVKWPISLRKVGVTKGNCHYLLKPFAVTSTSTTRLSTSPKAAPTAGISASIICQQKKKGIDMKD